MTIFRHWTASQSDNDLTLSLDGLAFGLVGTESIL